MNSKDDRGTNPLVSICTTFFNAERYIHRLLESCLNQTYKNIEIIVVDDASTDKSERVIRRYVTRDSRIKYYRNKKRTDIAECFLKMSHLAKGDLSMIVGADDWLARDYIENGVLVFLKHHDIAGVIPSLTTLSEHENDVFRFKNRHYFSSGIRSAEYFVKCIYKPTHLYISGYALVRSKDLVRAIEYYAKNYYRNPSRHFPEELLKFFKRVYGYDTILFLEILSRYKRFAFDNSLNYIKIEHSKNQTFDLAWGSSLAIFKNTHYYLLIYKHIYENKWPKFYGGLKIYLGAEMLSSALIYFLRRGAKFNFSDSKKHINGFFRELSFFEIVMTVIYSIPMVLGRYLGSTKRKLIKNNKYKAEEIFTQKSFLDSEGRFKIN